MARSQNGLVLSGGARLSLPVRPLGAMDLGTKEATYEAKNLTGGGELDRMYGSRHYFIYSAGRQRGRPACAQASRESAVIRMLTNCGGRGVHGDGAAVTETGRIFHKPCPILHLFELFDRRKDWKERAGILRDDFLGATTARIGRQAVSMPISATLTDEDVIGAIAAIEEIVR